LIVLGGSLVRFGQRPEHLDLERVASARVLAARLVAAASHRMDAHGARVAFGIADRQVQGVLLLLRNGRVTEGRAWPARGAWLLERAELRVDAQGVGDRDLVALWPPRGAGTHFPSQPARPWTRLDLEAAHDTPANEVAVVTAHLFAEVLLLDAHVVGSQQ